MFRLALLFCLAFLGAVLSGRAEGAATSADVVQVTTTNPDGPYGPTNVINIQVVFSSAVDLTGQPELVLNTRLGGDPILCTTASGTIGTTSLNFQYTVATGDQSALLDVENAGSLQLNGGSIYVSTTSIPATLTLPVGSGTANSLSNQHTIVIEQNATHATVTDISGPEGSDGVYGTNKTLSLTVTFSEPVFVNSAAPAPTLQLDASGTSAGTYAGGSGTATLDFSYTPVAGDSATNLDATSLGNPGSITDAIGALPSPTTIPTGTQTGSLYFRHYDIDTTPPTIQSIYSTVNATYGIGETVPILVEFSEDVQVTGVPTLALATTPATVVQFSGYYGGGSGPASVLEFNYVVQGGQDATLLDTIAPAQGLPVSTNGGTIRDIASNDADLSVAPVPGAVDSLSYNNDIIISTFPPTITGISTVEKAGTYATGTPIHILVSFGGLAGVLATPVGVTFTGPAPTLQLNTGTANKYATCIGNGASPSILEFVYTIAAGDSASPLDYTSTLALQANGAVISDAVGNVASTVLPAPGSTDGLFQSGIIVATPPAVSGLSSTLLASGNPYKAGTVVPITITFTAAVNVTGTPTLTLNATGTASGAPVATASYAGGSGTTALLFDYTVQPGDYASPLDVASTGALTLSGGTITAVSNAASDAVLTLPAPGSATSLGTVADLTVDGVAPAIASITSSPATATYGVNGVIPISVVMTKPVTVTGSPGPTLQLNFQSNGVTAVATFTGVSSGKSPPALLFTYKVQNGDTDGQLDDAGTVLLANGATIVDQAGNAANLTLPSPPDDLAGSTTIAIDTSTPSVVSYLSSPTDTAYGPGQDIPIIVTFSEPVTVDTTSGTPQILMDTGNDASYLAGSGTDTLLFVYQVEPSDPAGILDAENRSAFTLGGATIANAAGTSASLELPNSEFQPQDCLPSCQITLNTAGATVTSITTSDASGVYGLAAVIPLTVTFSSPVTVVTTGGVPTLGLGTTPNQGLATYVSGSGTATLLFDYTVGSGQSAAPLDCASATALALNGGTISDQYGNPAILTLPLSPAAGSLPTSATIAIEPVAPAAAPSITSVTTSAANGTYVTGAAITLLVTFTSAVQVSGIPELELNDAGSTGVVPVAIYQSGSGSQVLTFTYTVLGGQSTPQLEVLSTNALQLGTGAAIFNPYTQAVTTVPAPGHAGSLSSSSDLDINPGTSGSGKPLAANVVGDTPGSSPAGCGLGGGTALLAGLLLLSQRGARRSRRSAAAPGTCAD